MKLVNDYAFDENGEYHPDWIWKKERKCDWCGKTYVSHTDFDDCCSTWCYVALSSRERELEELNWSDL